MKLEQKYNILGNLAKMQNAMHDFSLAWDFKHSDEFDEIVKKFIKNKGIVDKDVYYISNVEVDIADLKNLKCGESIDFGSETKLQRIECEEPNVYLYYNAKPIAFGLHIHRDFSETITPLENDLIFYIKVDGEYKKVNLKVGESFTIPRNVEHAGLFSKENLIKLDWKIKK